MFNKYKYFEASSSSLREYFKNTLVWTDAYVVLNLAYVRLGSISIIYLVNSKISATINQTIH